MRLLGICFLFCCVVQGVSAQIARPEIINRGDTLFAPESSEYQWLLDGNPIPGAVGPFHVMQAPGVYTVRLRSLISESIAYTPGPTVVVTGAVLDEFLRPINGATVVIEGVKANTNAEGRFIITAPRAQRLAARATVAGFHAHTVAFMPTAADTQFVYLLMAKQITTHKLPAAEGGTISQGGFWLTLPPNSVVTADGKRYSGEIQLSVVARRPGDRDFAQRMPGGDFMAVDKSGTSKILYSYGFTGVEMTTADGKPLNMAPDSVATIEFLITEDQRPGAPDTIPLWHFDEVKGLWVEAGVIRKEGLTYRAQVPHFSWWNCDVPYEMAVIECDVINCHGEPAGGTTINVNQMEASTDSKGHFTGRVPATIELDFHVVNTDTTLAPLAQEETRALGTFDAGWGTFQAVGLADTNKLLTIYTYGNTEGVEYSLDGEHWQSETVFLLQDDSIPAQSWARAKGCETRCLKVVTPQYFGNCQLYDTQTLYGLPIIKTAEQLFNAQEAIYCIGFINEDIQLVVQAAKYQPCVQHFSFVQGINTPNTILEACDLLIGQWQNLQGLGLSGNQLSSLPELLFGITNLRLLELYGNKLKQLPESIGKLNNLQSLVLFSNELDKLPESFGSLTKLEELLLGNNKLTSLPRRNASKSGQM